MDTAYLREYIEFSRSLNFAQAAADLFVSPPTLRAHIHALEEEVGAPLTVKRVGHLELSPAGRLFLKRARAIVKLVEESAEECRALAEASSSIVVGTLDYAPFEELLTRALHAFRRDHPDRCLEMLMASGAYANMEAVESGKADLSIFVQVRRRDGGEEALPDELPAGVGAFRFSEGECRFWMNRSCPLFECDRVTAADLDGFTMLLGNSANMERAGRVLIEWFAGVGVAVEPDNQPCSNYLDLYLSGTGETFGIALGGSALGSAGELRHQDIRGRRFYGALRSLCDLQRGAHRGEREAVRRLPEGEHFFVGIMSSGGDDVSAGGRVRWRLCRRCNMTAPRRLNGAPGEG